MALMHRGATRIYEETRGMTRAEELAYWKQQAVRHAAVLAKAHRRKAKRVALAG